MGKLKADLLLDIRATLGEGPIWDDRRQLLFWVDILEGKLFAYDPLQHENQAYDIGQFVGTVVPVENGSKVMLALESGFASYDLGTRELALIHNPEADMPDNRFNDGKCDPNGRFWAGTMAKDAQGRTGSLYCLDVDLSVRKVLKDIGVSNGLAWSLDGTVMYYIDTPNAGISAFDFDQQKGTIANERIVVSIPAEMGNPDGMTVDEQGLLWVALWGGSRVCCWDPGNGRLLHTIQLPVSLVTACAFGGPDLDTLYITSARTGLSKKQLQKEPHAGSLFVVNPGTRGMPAYRFAGSLNTL